jgi:hypothetical protein
VVEVGAAVAPLLAPWRPKLGVLGGLLATGTFLTTLFFLATTPGLLAPGNEGGGFILKDPVLLGAALHVAGTSILAIRPTEAGARTRSDILSDKIANTLLIIRWEGARSGSDGRRRRQHR